MSNAEESRLSELDAAVDAVDRTPHTSAELFAVVDVLDEQASLRRALTDPGSSVEARRHLAGQLFGGRVGAATASIVDEAIALRWHSGRALADALERQAVRSALGGALRANQLDAVIAELSGVKSAVESSGELREALRDPNYPVEARQQLLGTLTADKVTPVTTELLNRAVAARQRTFSLTLDGYLQLAAEQRERKIARVRVARPLADDQAARLRAALIRQVGHDVDLQVQIDPDVLGGISVQFGHEVIDDTVAARLDDARRHLINQ